RPSCRPLVSISPGGRERNERRSRADQHLPTSRITAAGGLISPRSKRTESPQPDTNAGRGGLRPDRRGLERVRRADGDRALTALALLPWRGGELVLGVGASHLCTEHRIEAIFGPDQDTLRGHNTRRDGEIEEAHIV